MIPLPPLPSTCEATVYERNEMEKLKAGSSGLLVPFSSPSPRKIRTHDVTLDRVLR